MNTKLARSVVPTVEICPDCKRIAEVTPVLFADGLQDVTYKCKGCRLEMKRTFKRRLGAWQLIRYTPKFAALPRYR
jgi:lysyl-tRNA synthetase class I